MKKIIPVFLIFCLLLCICCKQSPTTPSTPVIPECEKNHTAQVTFQNKSTTNLTYDVIWDGSKLTTIAPGTSSQAYTVAAGKHTLLFRITNTWLVACAQSSPVLAQCHSYKYWCTT